MLPSLEQLYPVYANMGGPMSRTRQQSLESSILGRGRGAVRCPLRRTIGIRFQEGQSALKTIERLMKKAGLASTDELRSRFELPESALLARECPNARSRMAVDGTPALQILEQALWLGLCTAQFFDPQRPVLWTEVSLRRCLEVFEPAGFYV